MNRSRGTLRLFSIALVFLVAAGARAIPAPVSSGEDVSQSREPGEKPPVVVERGVLKNRVHGFRFPVPAEWVLGGGATAEEMVFSARDCEECALRVMVSPGNALPLMDTVRAIQEQIKTNAAARIVGEEPVRIAREDGYTIVKQESMAEPAPEPTSAAPRKSRGTGSPSAAAEGGGARAELMIKTRYVTFGHAGDKYYIFLRAPESRFATDDAALEKLLGKFRFMYFSRWFHPRREG